MDMKNRMVRPSNEQKPVGPPAGTVPKTTPQIKSQPPVAKVGAHEKTKKRRKWPVFIGILILVLAAGFGVFAYSQSGTGAAINGNKFQAVFLTNGQVYFGRLSKGNGYYKLSDVYYLQNKTSDKNESDGQLSSAGDAELIKLGSEVHGPEDHMIIERSQVLFFENLKSDGKVTRAIEQHQKNR